MRAAPRTAIPLAALLGLAPAAFALSSSATPSAPPPPASPVEAHDLFLQAREAERAGDDSTALERYGQAFRRDPRSRDLCFLYLGRLKDAGAVDSAVAVGQTCARLGGRLAADEHKLLGEIALRADDSPSALRHYRAADSLGGAGRDADGDVLYVLAGLYEERGDWEAYAAVVERLLPRLEYPPRLMDRLARAYARLGRPGDLLPMLRAAWDRTGNPGYGEALAAHYEAARLHLSLLAVARRLAVVAPGPEHDWMLARAYAAADRPDSALALSGALLAALPDHPGVRYLRASLLFEAGRYKEALALAEGLAKEFPDIPAHHHLAGSAALELGKRRARASLGEAVSLSPLAPEYRARLAYADYVAGDHGLAERRAAALLAYAASDSPDSLNAEQALLLEGLAHGMLARDLEPRGAGERPAVFSDSLAARRHRARAAALFEAVLARNSGHRGALFEAGAHFERLGERDRSKALMRRLVGRDTANALAMNYLAYTIVEQDSIPPGEMEEAGRLLDRALALEPENGAYRDSKGWWHFRNGAPDSAFMWLDRASESLPGDPAVLEHLVQVLYALDRRDEACTALAALRRRNPAPRVYLHCADAPASPRKDGNP